MRAERLPSTLICGAKTCRGLWVRLRHPTFPSTTWIESPGNEAVRMTLYKGTEIHLYGSDSSAVAAIQRPRRSGRTPAAFRPAPPAASDPPRSRSGVRRYTVGSPSGAGSPVPSGPPTGPTFNAPHRDRGSGAGSLEDQDGCRLLDRCSHRHHDVLHSHNVTIRHTPSSARIR